ncbi:Trp biosynthesis-associated membrane protein [Actinocorallia sp. API 0066]|uniref:Trp biosynthesis-associated membrane protein n=1 Tax=Actinocorallia sp. API 0066 TaxID=2896846 RepID=UPI001E409D59|nr:Trp biosynthesis-associated membrane protein [Actinocorallia sp. API 0066]MCD0450811.1 Trp biosynthesis-associated membrane protein [Actinocorallia sp. API 0066]
MTAVALVAVAGAALTLFASGRVWAFAELVGDAGQASPHGGATIAIGSWEVAGGDLAATAALGWAALAATAAVFAVRGVGRIAVGVLLALLGALTVPLALTAVDDASVRAALVDRTLLVAGERIAADATVWPWLAAAGGVVVALSGLWTAVRGHAWPGMSARYERGSRPVRAASPDDPSALWKSLDRGEDPTADTSGGGA